MTLITERIADMRRIVDAAGGRDLTKSQLADYKTASRDVLDAATDLDNEAVRDFGSAIKSVDDLPGIVTALEGWSARHNGGRKSAGRAFMEPDGPINGSGSYGGSTLPASYKSVASWGAEFEQERTRSTKALLDPGTVAVSVPLAAEPVTDARQARFVYELIPAGDAPDGHFAYLKQNTRTNLAAVVARGALKPTSIYTLERVDDTTEVIAHLSEPIDRFWLEDGPTLGQFLDQELRYGLAKALDARAVLNITTEATAGSATVDLAGIRGAITELEELDLTPSGIVMTPSDWETVEAEATTTFASNDNFPAATDALARRLFSVPVAVTNSIDVGSALVGAFRDSARIYRTGSASVTIHDSQPRDVAGTLHADYTLNQLVMRAEMRAEVAVTRPAGFILVGGQS